jgi:hypothetical protein
MYVGKGASFHGLTAASADVDGAAVPLVVGWTGWAVAKTRWDDGTSRYDVGLVAASVAPVPRATRPVVLLTPPRPGGRWNGRLSGIAFSTGAPPALSYGTSAGRARRIDVADETSEDFGDAETQSPGISLLVLPEGAVFERGFDLAVQFPPGPQTVTVRAEGRHGERAEASRDVLTPPEIPPDVLDADFHVLEVRDGGDLWAWGQNIAGVIGDGTYDRSPASPKPLAMPTDVVAVGAGSMYSIAADARGDVWVWGDIGDVDVSGGVVTDTYAPWPRRVDALDGIVAISAGYEDALALDASGGVWLWQYDTPHVREIRGAPPLAAVAAGETADVGLDLDGGVWHLDAKDAAGKRKPALLTGFPAASAVAGGEDEVLVLGTDGAVWQWTGAANAPVVRVTLPGRATAVSAGYYYSLALLEDGTVWAWSSSQETPQGIEGIRVRNLDGITSIVAGSGDKSFALDADGFLWMWPSFDLLGGEERPVLAPREYRPGGIPPARATLPKRPPRKR